MNPSYEGRILVVDDNDAGRYATGRILRQAGFEVLEAVSGGEALRRVTDDRPDVVLLDVRLPDISGLEVCRRIKANPGTALIPVLQMSAAFRDDKSKVAGLEGGADGYITEPIEPKLLIATIAAFLRMRRAEQSVRELARQWQSTFDAIRDGVALVDTEGRIQRSNRALADLLGHPAAELVGVGLDELLPPDEGQKAVWPNLQSTERQHMERSSGGRSFSIAIDSVCSDEGRVTGGVCIVSDVTERKLLDQRMWHTQKLESIGILAGGVAHDFNNLLMGVMGNASLALESLDDVPSTERALRDIVRASERAADLTRQLLAYAGKGRFIIQHTDLTRMVNEIVPLIQASFPRKVHLKLNLAPGLPPIEADKTQIEQVVMNLLINAAEAIGDGSGTITVTTELREVRPGQEKQYLTEQELSGSYVMLEVRDDGIGMDEETVRRVFDPFFTTKFMGRGLGLSAALGIVRSHSGAIRVSSVLGQGTSFELLFPRSVTVKREVPPVAASVSQNGRGTILVVDDEAIVRGFFRQALIRHGYEVVLARDGAEALEIYSRMADRISIVLLDLVMPVMTGKEVLPRLLDIRPDAIVIITSGQMEEEARRGLESRNIAGFIQKPCAVGTLIDRINHFSEAKNPAA
ncbi:MAG TPA: response regulator [Bryobacteraceae bacterium]